MNTLIVSTFSCSFDSFKKDVTDFGKLGAAMADPVATEWDKKNNCQDTVYKIELVD